MGELGVGQVGGAEGHFHVIDFGEVVGVVVGVFAHHAVFDEEEDHFSNVGAMVDVPVAHDAPGEGAKFTEGVVAVTEEEFFGIDVLGRVFAVFFFGAVEGEVEGFAQEVVGLGGMLVITGGDDGYSLFKGAHDVVKNGLFGRGWAT